MKKNNNFKSSFTYNRSGIEVEHYGLVWVQETVKMEAVSSSLGYSEGGGGVTVYPNDFKYKFQLKPNFQISHVRKKSAAARSGLKSGDVIVKINRLNPYEMTLQEIRAIFKDEDNKWITIEVQRNNIPLKFQFQLDNIL